MGKPAVVAFLLLSGTLPAQDWQVYDMSTAAFPSVTVQCLAQDLAGNIWAGTDWGLCIQDGPQWNIWQTSNSGLPENNIRAIAFDAQGGAWIGTLQSGLLYFDGSDWSSYTTADSPLPDDQINALVVDGLGRVWAGTPGGLAMKDGNVWRIYDDSPESHAGFRFFGRHITHVAVSDDGTVAATTMNGGYACFNETDFVCFTAGQHGFPDNSGYAVAFDANGDRWVGTTTAGIVRHAGPFLDVLWFPFSVQNSALPDNTVRAIALDAAGRKIIGTEISGVAILDQQGDWSLLNAANSGLPDDQVRCVFIDRDDVLWVGTWQGGLARYAPMVGIGEQQVFDRTPRSWPNPFNDRVVVDLSSMHGLLLWELLDRQGRTLANGRTQGGASVELRFDHMAMGAYTLRITEKDKVHFVPLLRI
jgi:ligand-binding sensor domain-containing protein